MHPLLIRLFPIECTSSFKLTILLFLLFIGNSKLSAQSPFGFSKNQSIPLFGLNEQNAFPNGWAGGLNAPQFNECELNGDGLLDVIVFERTGNKLLCFVRNADGNSFHYAPEFESLFPPMHDWMLIRDYNLDGKPDIFTSAGNGIKIIKNTSPTSITTQFTTVTDLLYSDYGNGLLNLYVSPVDFPGIDDVDNDGDLDIVTFYILGTCVEYHRNLSQELFGNSDSIRYELVTENWGKFTESSINNSINLQDSCGRSSGVRHFGSTLLLDDIDHDGDKDLLLGDISYPDIKCLINNPLNGLDVIIQTPSNYPSAFSTYQIPIYPGAFRIHCNADSLPDLVIAPNTDDQSINKGRLALSYPSNNTSFNFTGTESTFLSHEIFDLGRGAYPCFIDNDNDGDLDVIVGNFGEFEPNVNPVLTGNYRASLQLLENIGSNNAPSYKVVNADIAQLRSLNAKHLAPAAADLNGDGKSDLIVGSLSGSLIVLLKNATGNDYTISNGIASSITADQYACPTFADINQDGKKDLILGGKSGRLQCYFNNGTTTLSNFPSTPSITNFGNVETIEENFSNYGYSSPCYFSNSQGKFIFSGSESGNVYLWKLNSNDLIAPFTILDSSLASIKDGDWSAPTISDLNSDGFPEMILGFKRGGLNFFQGQEPTGISEIQSKLNNINLYPNPTNNAFQINSESLNLPANITIYDISGRIIKQESLIIRNQLIEISNLSSGVYIVNIINKHRQTKNLRLIIKH